MVAVRMAISISAFVQRPGDSIPVTEVRLAIAFASRRVAKYAGHRAVELIIYVRWPHIKANIEVVVHVLTIFIARLTSKMHV